MESWYPDQLHLALASQIAQDYFRVNVSLWVLRQNQVVKSLYSYSKALGERWSLRQTLYPYRGGVYNDKQSLVLPEMGWITIGTIGGLLIRLAIWSIFLTPKGDLQDLTIIRFVLWVTWILWSLGSSPWLTQVHKVQNAAHGGGTRVGPGGMAHTVTVSKIHEI